ncbi:hypothetical protein V2J09_006812 [Rumex salicifolius]
MTQISSLLLLHLGYVQIAKPLNLTWSAIFGSMLWWTWKWQNMKAFDGALWTANTMNFVREYASEYRDVMIKRSSTSNSQGKETCLKAWESSWRLDQSEYKWHLVTVATRGVIRDETGAWITSFTHNSGSCSVPQAKVWDILGGLQLAWDNGHRQVIF